MGVECREMSGDITTKQDERAGHLLRCTSRGLFVGSFFSVFFFGAVRNSFFPFLSFLSLVAAVARLPDVRQTTAVSHY